MVSNQGTGSVYAAEQGSNDYNITQVMQQSDRSQGKSQWLQDDRFVSQRSGTNRFVLCSCAQAMTTERNSWQKEGVWQKLQQEKDI